MELRIIKNQAVSIKLQKIVEKLDKSREPPKNSFSIDFSLVYHNSKTDIFTVMFDIKLTHPNDFILEIEYAVWFKTSEPIDEDFKKSNFPSINAPAIAFPLLRSLIATITVNSGYQAVLLPSINFEKMIKNKGEK